MRKQASAFLVVKFSGICNYYKWTTKQETLRSLVAKNVSGMIGDFKTEMFFKGPE